MRLKWVITAAAALVSASPAIAAWHQSTSRHFVIYGDASPSWLRAYSTKLEKFDQAVRRLQKMDDPPPGEAGRVTIFLLPDEASVSQLVYGRKTNVAGFYIPRAGGSVAFVPKRTNAQDSDEGAEQTLFHEYAHHLMYQSTDTALPGWLIEGFAEFYSAARFEQNNTVRVAMPLGAHAFSILEKSRPSADAMFASRVNMLANEDAVSAFYGWSWLYTHYLTFSGERAGQLDAYLAALRAGVEPMKAAQDNFGDLDKLGDDARRYLKRNSFKNWAVQRPGPDPSTIATRPLRPGEVAIMPIVMDLRRGKVDDAKALAAKTRTVAAAFPDDPAVQLALAEAELEGFNFAAADKAATRATELDPRSGDAWILRGRARMELVDGSESDADWTAIRANFLKANAIDKEDAEPLWLYFQSFGRAGQSATQNAKEGLDYALLLAPQDDGLRLTTIAQQLADKRVREARQSLLTLAYAPHPGPVRETARKAVAAIDAGDAAGARKALYE